MARKYSLKDNPIFQGLQAPEPPPEPSLAPEALEVPTKAAAAEVSPQFGGQNLTPKNRPSKFDPLNAKSDESYESALEPAPEAPPDPKVEAAAEAEAPPPYPARAEAFDLRDNIDRFLFFGFYNGVADVLLPTLEPSSQVLYSRLFRLSYGFNRNYCTVSQPLLMEKTGLSRNTVRTSLQSLSKDGWVRIVESGNHISTTYRIVLPREQDGNDDFRISKSDPQNLTLKNRASETNPLGGQNSEVQNLTPKNKISNKHDDFNDLESRVSNFEGQKSTPLLSLTNRSLTLSERESDGHLLTPEDSKTFGQELVGKFYTRLGQRASKTKREQSVQECLSLFDDGFTPEEVDYAIDWLIEYHPETGAFNRVLHFIDQAIKEREATLQAAAEKERLRAEAEHQTHVAMQQVAEREQVEAVLDTLSASVRKKLEQQAARLVQEEHGNVAYGRETLIRLKVEELVRDQHFEL